MCKLRSLQYTQMDKQSEQHSSNESMFTQFMHMFFSFQKKKTIVFEQITLCAHSIRAFWRK